MMQTRALFAKFCVECPILPPPLHMIMVKLNINIYPWHRSTEGISAAVSVKTSWANRIVLMQVRNIDFDYLSMKAVSIYYSVQLSLLPCLRPMDLRICSIIRQIFNINYSQVCGPHTFATWFFVPFLWISNYNVPRTCVGRSLVFLRVFELAVSLRPRPRTGPDLLRLQDPAAGQPPRGRQAWNRVLEENFKMAIYAINLTSVHKNCARYSYIKLCLLSK